VSSYHLITIVGYVGSDPIPRTTPSGVTVTNMSIATTEKWTDKSGAAQERTVWFKAALFDRLGEVAAQYTKKGSLVLITGTISASPYINRDGQAAASLEVRARDFKMLGRAPDHEGDSEERTASVARNPAGPAAAKAAARGQQATSASQEARPPVDEFDDDIPF
jgi:single-strand DNA-binding protein